MPDNELRYLLVADGDEALVAVGGVAVRGLDDLDLGVLRDDDRAEAHGKTERALERGAALLIGVLALQERDAEALEEIGPPLARHRAQQPPEEDGAHRAAPVVGHGHEVAAVDDVAFRRDLVGGVERRAGVVHVEDAHRALRVIEELVVDRHERLERETAAGERREHLLHDGDGEERGVHQPRLRIREGGVVDHVVAEVARGDVGGVVFLERDDRDRIAEDGDLALHELGAHLVVVGDDVAVEREELAGVAVLRLLDDAHETVCGEVADQARQLAAGIEVGDLVVVFLHGGLSFWPGEPGHQD